MVFYKASTNAEWHAETAHALANVAVRRLGCMRPLDRRRPGLERSSILPSSHRCYLWPGFFSASVSGGPTALTLCPHSLLHMGWLWAQKRQASESPPPFKGCFCTQKLRCRGVVPLEQGALGYRSSLAQMGGHSRLSICKN